MSQENAELKLKNNELCDENAGLQTSVNLIKKESRKIKSDLKVMSVKYQHLKAEYETEVWNITVANNIFSCYFCVFSVSSNYLFSFFASSFAQNVCVLLTIKSSSDCYSICTSYNNISIIFNKYS